MVFGNGDLGDRKFNEAVFVKKPFSPLPPNRYRLLLSEAREADVLGAGNSLSV